MPFSCGHSGTTTLALQASTGQVPNSHSHSKIPILSQRRHCRQLPGPACQQTTARTRYGSARGTQTETLTLCRAQKQEEKEKDMVGGFDVDAEPGFLESNAVGIIFQVQHYVCNDTYSEQNAHLPIIHKNHSKALACGLSITVWCRLASWHLCLLELQPYCCWHDQLLTTQSKHFHTEPVGAVSRELRMLNL